MSKIFTGEVGVLVDILPWVDVSVTHLQLWDGRKRIPWAQMILLKSEGDYLATFP